MTVPSIVTSRGSESLGVTRKPTLTVYFPPEEVIRGTNEVTLVCLVTGTQPLREYTITWSESENHQHSTHQDVYSCSQENGTSFMVTSVYKTTKTKWHSSTMFECTFQSDGYRALRAVSQAQGKLCEHPTNS